MWFTLHRAPSLAILTVGFRGVCLGVYFGAWMDVDVDVNIGVSRVAKMSGEGFVWENRRWLAWKLYLRRWVSIDAMVVVMVYVWTWMYYTVSEMSITLSVAVTTYTKERQTPILSHPIASNPVQTP